MEKKLRVTLEKKRDTMPVHGSKISQVTENTAHRRRE
jgi:hypothetical protein